MVVRRMANGYTAPLTVILLDENDQLIWDASPDVADVLQVTGWPAESSAGRDTVVGLLEAILVLQPGPVHGQGGTMMEVCREM